MKNFPRRNMTKTQCCRWNKNYNKIDGKPREKMGLGEEEGEGEASMKKIKYVENFLYRNCQG